MSTRFALIAVLVYAAAFRLATLNRPFRYDDESTGSFYGVLARNSLRAGIIRTRGIPVETVGRRPDGGVAYYADHPPLVTLLIALAYAVFGVSEWQTRLPTAIATVVSVYALYRLLAAAGAARAGLIAAATFALVPMTLYFGGLAEVLGMPLVLFSVVTVAAYMAAHERPTSRRVLLLGAAFAMTALADWPAFILVPVLGVHWLATQPRREWRWIAIVGAAAAALFACMYAYIAWGARLPWTWMLPLVAHRAGFAGRTFTTGDWLRTAWAFNRHVHTLPVCAAAAAWAVAQFLSVGTRDAFGNERRAVTATRLLLAWGLAHVLIGRQGVFNHEWWWYPLTPGLAAATALLVDDGVRVAERRGVGALGAAAAVAAVAGFGAWTSIATVRQLYGPDPSPFTPAELGAAIRAAAPQPNDVALLVWSGSDPEVWFYGDRPLRANVWSIDDFEASIDRGTVDLVFDDLEPWPGRAVGVVFPAASRTELSDLHRYIERRCRRLAESVGGKFDVYALR